MFPDNGGALLHATYGAGLGPTPLLLPQGSDRERYGSISPFPLAPPMLQAQLYVGKRQPKATDGLAGAAIADSRCSDHRQ